MQTLISRGGPLGILLVLLPITVAAGVPTDQTRFTLDQIISLLKDPALQSEPRKNERRRKLRAVIYPRFDFAEMAKRTLGPHWSRRTAQEQQEFVNLFTDLLEHSYVEKIESYNGEKIVYTGERLEHDHAQVFTNIVTKNSEQFSINYKLHRIENEWKVYDIVIEDISLVNNYRSQFRRVLDTAGYDELLRRLRQKKTSMHNENR